VAQRQSQCSIFANQQLKVSNIFLCSCCFRPIVTWLSFCCWPTLINPFCFSDQSFRPFSRNFAAIVQYLKSSFCNVSIWALSSYDILSITKVIRLTAIMTWNIEEVRACYNALLHVNIKIMTSQQRWYLLLSYFNNKINFLFSCEIRSWSLHFSQFDMSSKYSTKQYISAQYCAKQIREIWCKSIQTFLRYSNFCVGIFYFASPCSHLSTQEEWKAELA